MRENIGNLGQGFFSSLLVKAAIGVVQSGMSQSCGVRETGIAENQEGLT